MDINPRAASSCVSPPGIFQVLPRYIRSETNDYSHEYLLTKLDAQE